VRSTPPPPAVTLNPVVASIQAVIRGSSSCIGSGTGHRRTVPSRLPVNTHLPSEVKSASLTPRRWRYGGDTGLPVATSHTRAVWS